MTPHNANRLFILMNDGPVDYGLITPIYRQPLEGDIREATLDWLIVQTTSKMLCDGERIAIIVTADYCSHQRQVKKSCLVTLLDAMVCFDWRIVRRSRQRCNQLAIQTRRSLVANLHGPTLSSFNTWRPLHAAQ